VKFKRGAFVPGVPVQPVIVRYPFNNFTLAWTSHGPQMEEIYIRSLLQFYNTMSIEYLPEYRPSEEEIRDPDLFAENVRMVMARAMAVPTVDLSMEDALLAQWATRWPSMVVNMTVSELRTRFGAKVSDLKELFDLFFVFDAE